MSSEYAAYDIRQLFAMVDAARQTLDPSHEQIKAWNRSEQMLRQHGTALQGFRDQLAAKWPPESNAAAAAYLVELDRLLQAVNQTGQAASANAVQLGHVTDAITQAHATLKPLHDEYVSNAAKIEKYNDTVNNVAVGVAVVSGPVAGLVTKGAAELFTSPPVDDGRQDQIQQQARQAMDRLGGVARDAAVTMTPPPEYIPPRVRRDDAKHVGSDSTGGATRPPTIVAPTRAESQGIPTGRLEVTSDSGTTASDSNASVSGTGSSSGGGALRPSSGLTGAELAGVITPPPPPAAPSPAPSVGLPLPPGPSPAPGILPGLLPPTAAPSGGAAGGRPAPTTSPGIGGGAGGTGARALPPGGRIDSFTGTAAAPRGGQLPGALGQVPGSQPGMRRVNPVGGVIGGQGGPTGTAGSVPASNSGVPGGGLGRRGQRTSNDQGHHWDPDNPWEVAAGVTPVITPEPAAPVDVGPGIIGVDR